MLKVAVTGNIASGKSTVCKIIAALDYPFASCDSFAHRVLKLPMVIQALSHYDVLDHFGKISRKKLGKLAFTNPKVKSELEKITHPLIFAEIDKFFESHQQANLAFVEVPLLFEVDAADQFDIVILVYANDDIRLARLMQRNGLSKPAALARINSQMNQNLKVPKSTHVIYNNDDNPNHLEAAIKTILEKIHLKECE